MSPARPIAMAALTAAAVCLAIQALIWLRTGQWPSALIGHALDAVGIPRPRTSWIGLDTLIGGAARIPIAVALAMVGAAAWIRSRKRRALTGPWR